ncbi:MAG: DUF1840 family protein, partial [Deltaproteobacteria bacterium]|nr:DUF1840 family protein [Deltaproteobacteria bacterium]
TQRGVFMKEQLPDAIARLQGTVDEDKLETKLAKMSDDKEVHTRHETYPYAKEEMSKSRISLVQRAKPFIHFLELTKNENGF